MDTNRQRERQNEFHSAPATENEESESSLPSASALRREGEKFSILVFEYHLGGKKIAVRHCQSSFFIINSFFIEFL